MVSRSLFAISLATLRPVDHRPSHPLAFSAAPAAIGRRKRRGGDSPSSHGGRSPSPRHDDELPPPPIASAAANGLRELASSLRHRERGSRNLLKGWLTWRTTALNAIRADLSTNLPFPPDERRFEILHRRLGFASDAGCTVDVAGLLHPAEDEGAGGGGGGGGRGLFEDPGARSGYALGFLFTRATNLADLVFDAWNDNPDDDGDDLRYDTLPIFWTEGFDRTKSPMPGVGRRGEGNAEGDDGDHGVAAVRSLSSSSISAVSLGGGPGFDFVGIALAASFCSYRRASEENGASMQLPLRDDGTTVTVTVLDDEDGWHDVVRAVGDSTRRVLGSPHDATTTCVWGGRCDITKSLYDPINSACLDLVESAPRLFTCQYCVGENAASLRKSDHVFFRELFERAQCGSMFVFTEAHPRAWPDFFHLVEGLERPYMQIGFHKNGRRMLLRKRLVTDDLIDDEEGRRQRQGKTIIEERDREMVRKFEEIGRSHTRNMSSGYMRQVPKSFFVESGRDLSDG